MTVPEYFERRYARGVRVLAGVLMAVGGSLNLGIFPLIEARFLNIVTGIDPRYVTWTMAALLLLALVYTALGGMVSLVFTNYLQYVLPRGRDHHRHASSACTTTGWGGDDAGGHGTVWTGRGRSPSPTPTSGLAFVVWQILLWIALMTVWQSVAQRAFSPTDTRREARLPADQRACSSAGR